MLSQRLEPKLWQRQVLTPGLVQMMSVLQMPRLELKEAIAQEIEKNPMLEESLDGGEEVTPEEMHNLLEAERVAEPADASILEATNGSAIEREADAYTSESAGTGDSQSGLSTAAPAETEPVEAKVETDPFDEIDFGEFFNDYLDPGPRTPAAESVDKPSFETFLSTQVTLSSYLESQLSLVAISDAIRDAADTIIGNLDENGWLTMPIEEIAQTGGHTIEDVLEALKVVQSLDPDGIGARDLRECMLLQIEDRNGKDGVAWQIVANHLKLLESRQIKELAKAMGRPMEHIQIALNVIRHLDPYPGRRYSDTGARQIEPDVFISKDGDSYLIQLNDEDIPQIRLNPKYRDMLSRAKEPDKEVRNYVKERYASALQLMKNIEQRKQTILRVCQAVVRRQADFLESGIDQLKPMMIKEVAEEIGVHPSTVSRAVAGKYAHTPQGVFELRYFFSEAVQGIAGSATPLLVLKIKVKKMIEEEDRAHPLTDEQITARLKSEGIDVTRRTVAKYREDMKIPSTHQRRIRP
ncbi:MAG TPA: RNA polymerase factor sigma-54 [Bryobacteraceae bacterium]|nr:RNA polymerase factor sigma-54 [Bryobacteraceae bacterium]